jgi:hypothetical protein
MYRCISSYPFIIVYPCYYLALWFYSYTCWVPIITVLSLAIFPCYSNLLLRRRGWTGILRRGVLGYVLSRLSFMWSYGVFRCSVPLRIVIVFRDTIYVIIILYSWHLLSVNIFGRMCGTTDPGSCIWWVLGFDIKTGYDTDKPSPTWLWGPNQEIVVVILWVKSPNHSCQFWGPNQKTERVVLRSNREKPWTLVLRLN